MLKKTEVNPKWCADWCAAWNKGDKKTEGRCLCLDDYCKYKGHKGEPERVK